MSDSQADDSVGPLHTFEEDLQAVYDGLNEGVLIVSMKTKQFVRVNLAFCRAFGYAAEELQSMTPRDLYTPERLAEDGMKVFDAMCRREIKQVEGLPYRRKDGSVLYADVVVTPIVYRNEQCLLGFFRDGTQRKLATDAIRESERRYRVSESKLQGLLENLPDHVIVLDRNAKVVYINRNLACNDYESVVGHTILHLIAPEYRKRTHQNVLEVFANGQPRDNDTQDILGGWWKHRIIPLFGDNVATDGIEYVMMICTDVTERRRASEAIQKEQQLLRRLLDFHERERQLIAYEIHDGFAQQLTGAFFRLQAYRESQKNNSSHDDKELDATLQCLRSAIDETRRLISGLRPPVLDELGIVEAVRYLVYENQKNGGLKIDYEYDVPSKRLAAPLENGIFRIIQESLHNACRYSHSDRISVALRQCDDRIKIEVRDWGVGFDPTAVGRQHFGLQGVRERVRLLGGSIAIESEPNKGTCISVELPAVAADNTLGVIFDMDGVLIDSYKAHYRSWLEMAEADGLYFTEAEFAATFGRTARETIAYFWGDGRRTEEQIAEMDRRKEAAYRRIVETDFPAMPGATDLLRSLHDGGFKLAIGSSGPSENVGLVIEKLEGSDLFDAVVTGDDVIHGKPDPAVFNLAAERMCVRPANCVVIEDAPVGIAAAHAAGMLAIGLLSTGRTHDVLAKAGADAIVNSLAEVTPQMVEAMIADRKEADTEE